MKKQKFVKEELSRIKGELDNEISGIIGKREFEEFKKFAFKGHMIQMAIAFMMGAAFNKVIQAISENLIMPFIKFGISQTGNDWREYTYTPVTGLTLELGAFCAAFVDFFLISLVLYILYAKLVKPVLEDTKIKCIDVKICPYCQSKIHWKCVRCPQCTSELEVI